MVKFAHLADIHLGGWRQPEMQALNLEAFKQTISRCIQEKVDFIIIAGDLFDSAMPSIDILKETMSEFKKLNDSGTKCYLVPGSHDYSATGKTFLDVIEKAGFCQNVAKLLEQEDKIILELIEDNINGQDILLAGIPGKKSSMELDYFKKLKIDEKKLEEYEYKLKLFVFHSTITESKPEGLDFMESIDLESLPLGFDYYAGGHLHLVSEHNKQGKEQGQESSMIYPGPVFPNNIEELEKLKAGSFFILESQGSEIIKKTKQDIKLKDVLALEIGVDSLSSEQANIKILQEIEKTDKEQGIKDKILILKIKGTLSSGKTSDINFSRISEKTKQAYVLLKSTSGLTTQELKLEIKQEAKNIEEIEFNFIQEYNKKIQPEFQEFSPAILPLLSSLDTEKQEAEKKEVFEKRVFEEAQKILKLNFNIN